MPSRQFILTTFFIGLWYTDVRCHGLSDLQLSELSLFIKDAWTFSIRLDIDFFLFKYYQQIILRRLFLKP